MSIPHYTDDVREAILQRDREERKPTPDVQHTVFQSGEHEYSVRFVYDDKFSSWRTFDGRTWS